MSAVAQTKWRRSVIWISAALFMTVVLVTRLELSFDLSAFLPQQTTLAHEVLVEQIRTGPGSRLLVIGINGAPPAQLAEVSEQLKQTLAAEAAFVSVQNGEFAEDDATVPEPLASYYLLLRDIDYSRNALQNALASRLQDLAFGAGATFSELIARDPYLVTLQVLESLAPVDLLGDMWFAADGSAVLLAETRAASIDISAQADAIELVEQAFAAAADSADLRLEMTGVGAFSVELQDIIRAEAMKRTTLATGALLLVLFVIFRRPRLLLLATVPIGMGFLAGLTLVALLFDLVHGITLAFGFTLLGVAVDYPLHLFSHAQQDSGPAAMRRIWPTMRLGVVSTAIAYLALAFSGSEGLAQLGLFTAGGVTVAVLVTRTWLPLLLAKPAATAVDPAAAATAPSLRFVAPLLLLVVASAAIIIAVEGALWDDDLSSLSPVATDRLATDRKLRAAAVTPDMRYQLVLHDEELESLLETSEAVDELLEEAVAAGLLQGWQSVSQLLPSRRTQERRRDAIPQGDELRERIAEALRDMPFRADAFEPFAAGAAAAKSSPVLTPADIENTPLRSWLNSHLLRVGTEWVALISVVAPQPTALAESVAEWGYAADLVDLQTSSMHLMRDYRMAALRTILAAAIVIVGLLWLARGRLLQMLWIGLTVTAALTATIAIIAIVHGGLTVIHLVALLLVLGLGLDYALFLSRTESLPEKRATRRGVLACAASTTLAFAILAGSSIPVLKFIGLTVAAGSLISYAIAFGGSRLTSTVSETAA